MEAERNNSLLLVLSQARLDLEQEMTKKRSEAAASAFRIAEQIRQQTTMLQQTSGTTMAQMESVELAGERAICTRQKQAMESVCIRLSLSLYIANLLR